MIPFPLSPLPLRRHSRHCAIHEVSYEADPRSARFCAVHYSKPYFESDMYVSILKSVLSSGGCAQPQGVPEREERAMAPTVDSSSPSVFGQLPHRVKELLGGCKPSHGGVCGDSGLCWIAHGGALLVWKLDRGLHAHITTLGKLRASLETLSPDGNPA